MYLVAIGWIYVVLMMAVVEAMSSQGTLLGACVTFVLYGLLPLAVVLYIGATPARKRARRARELAEGAADNAQGVAKAASAQPDRAHVAPGDAAAAERKEA